MLQDNKPLHEHFHEVCSNMYCQLCDHGLVYTWHYITDMGHIQWCFNDKPGSRLGMTSCFLASVGSNYIFMIVLSVHLAVLWKTDIRGCHTDP